MKQLVATRDPANIVACTHAARRDCSCKRNWDGEGGHARVSEADGEGDGDGDGDTSTMTMTVTVTVLLTVTVAVAVAVIVHALGHEKLNGKRRQTGDGGNAQPVIVVWAACNSGVGCM